MQKNKMPQILREHKSLSVMRDTIQNSILLTKKPKLKEDFFGMSTLDLFKETPVD